MCVDYVLYNSLFNISCTSQWEIANSLSCLLLSAILTAYYEMSEKEDEPIPDNLQAISWMDGCHVQLHLTTQEDVLEFEKYLKVTACKQSAARTAVKQAADIGAMFKIIRHMIKQMSGGTMSNSPMF